jgi:hypothetical protein
MEPMRYIIEVECGLCGSPRHLMETEEAPFMKYRPNTSGTEHTMNFTDEEVDDELAYDMRIGNVRVKPAWDTCGECREP